jgi:hypothetical protein
LSNLNSEQIAMVFKFIEPVFWQRKLKDYLGDTEFIKSVLEQAGV